MTSNTRASTRRVLVSCATVLVVLATGGGPAAAHSDDGVMTVTAAEQVGPGQVRIEAGIVYANDDEPAEEATVTATLNGPAGEVVGPVRLERSSGALYGVQVQVPAIGSWSVAIGSTTPAAEATAALEVVSESSAALPSGPPVTGVVSAESAAAGSDEPNDSSPALWIVVGLGVILVAASAVIMLRRRSA